MIRVSVVGLGKMGLPIAAYLSANGAAVTGIDTNAVTVAAINSGQSPVLGETGLGSAIDASVSAGTLTANTSFDVVEDSDVVVVLVPLLAHGGDPDFSVLDDVTESIARHLSGDTLVVYETTLPVGATRNRFAPVLRASQPTTLVAFSPERVFSGRVFQDLETYPKIVGGVDEESTVRAVGFYESVLSADVWPVASSEEAEMVKLAETTYRDVNIAFANELARICDGLGIDVTDVIRGANSQPFSHIHQPGVGVGGHCIPHYPHLLLNAGIDSPLVRLGRQVNDGMPAWAVSRLRESVGSLEGQVVLGLGVSYRPAVKEHTSSPVFGVRDAVEAAGGSLVVTDSFYSGAELDTLGLVGWDKATAPDAVILITPHEEFTPDLIRPWNDIPVLDGRNAWDKGAVEAAGGRYLGFGR